MAAAAVALLGKRRARAASAGCGDAPPAQRPTHMRMTNPGAAPDGTAAGDADRHLSMMQSLLDRCDALVRVDGTPWCGLSQLHAHGAITTRPCGG